MRKSIATSLLVAAVVCPTAWAQPPDFAVYPGDEQTGPSRHQRQREDRLARVVEYLELSDSQEAEWEQITAQHHETTRGRWERIKKLRDEFQTVADQADPDVEQAGRIALELHREMEKARGSRNLVADELAEILTPDQAERFEALRAARELSGDRGPRGSRGRRGPKDSG
jgi:hypothetical protein